MNSRPDDMQGTTMRVRKRTTRYVEYLKGLFKLRTGKDYSPDDVVWEAINIAFGDDIKYIEKAPTPDEKKP